MSEENVELVRRMNESYYVGERHQSGLSLEDTPITAVSDLRGGGILRVRQFVDHAEALEAVGLSE